MSLPITSQPSKLINQTLASIQTLSKSTGSINFLSSRVVSKTIGEQQTVRTRAVASDQLDPFRAALLSKKTWRDREYREGYAIAAVEQGIAWQVRLNREARGMSQGQLAAKIGTKQSSVSRMEDPEYGSHSLKTLLKVAHAFDCALLVKFVPYSVLAMESRRLREADLVVASYDEEVGDEE